MRKENYSEWQRMPNVECPECDSPDVHSRPTPHKFKYGLGESAVEIECILPVRVCAQCGAEFVDEEGERVRHDAICRHLGLLTPTNIQELREREGTQTQFGDLTGIGEASLSRWETGASLQTKGYDNYLFLLQFQDNVERLRTRRARSQDQKPRQIEGRFRSIEITHQRSVQQRRFILRPAA
jgi:DNA-binding transcriptional regulator YiaG